MTARPSRPSSPRHARARTKIQGTPQRPEAQLPGGDARSRPGAAPARRDQPAAAASPLAPRGLRPIPLGCGHRVAPRWRARRCRGQGLRRSRLTLRRHQAGHRARPRTARRGLLRGRRRCGPLVGRRSLHHDDQRARRRVARLAGRKLLASPRDRNVVLVAKGPRPHTVPAHVETMGVPPIALPSAPTHTLRVLAAGAVGDVTWLGLPRRKV